MLQSLFKKDLVYISDKNTQEEIFEEIYNILLERGLVTEEFKEAIIEREKNFPTGLDLSPVGNGLPNVAIPHTETEYCKSKLVVVVKLNNSIVFNNMIEPDKELKVNYLFFIINDEKTKQSNVLSRLMSFITEKEKIEHLDKLNSESDIYEFLIKNI
ncbi:PTS sugar transporter subunit IIA [Clostridium sp. D2Q-14]|uniref:PTS sugar transporter subunit IIA n=1 Tax=Anaeromonas gelatinilytica TaxID=2683194 RepID=UPI00193B4305|nr:PTS sugar transporter subunit IIA [Anaeromonas gelatinilytica]MBS4535754.1 PTS sugar transporter subunit IIA [Anaeromonas gelatinilytica]